MQKFSQFVFLAFYFASTLGLSQERVLSALSSMSKSTREDSTQLHSPGPRRTICFPEYRHTKVKRGIDFVVGDPKSYDLRSSDPEEALQPLTDSVESLLILEGILSRAPPFPNQPVR